MIGDGQYGGLEYMVITVPCALVTQAVQIGVRATLIDRGGYSYD